MKQTAVDFYREHIHALSIDGKTHFTTTKQVYEQAKEMEKKQIEDAELRGKEIIIIKHTEHEGGNK